MATLNKSRFDTFTYGLIAGILVALIGFLLFGLVWSLSTGSSLKYFITDIFLSTGMFQDKVVTMSLLLDVLLFFVFMRKDWLNFCKGILAVVIIGVPITIYLY